MMDRATYDRYLACFTARDYDGVLAFYADDFVLEFAGYRFTTKAQVKAFYGFFHQYVDESIVVTAFLADATRVALEAVVRLEGRRALDAATLEAAGYGRLVPLAIGQVVEIPQFIHYHLRGGKIIRAACAVL
jgi:ketosteroid isomerase-like protein